MSLHIFAAGSMSGLETLCLDGCAKVTEKGLAALLKGSAAARSLTCLDISRCIGLSGNALDLPPKVSISSSQNVVTRSSSREMCSSNILFLKFRRNSDLHTTCAAIVLGILSPSAIRTFHVLCVRDKLSCKKLKLKLVKRQLVW